MSNTDLMALNLPAISHGYQYARFVENFPRLEAEEEHELVERLQSKNDLDAARLLILSHLRYVVYIARSYAGYGLPQEDLIQEGNIGLMKAVQRFDPSRGVRLVKYAAYWIRAHIHDYILNNWRIVKVATTKAKRKLFYKLRSAKKKLEWLRQDEAREIADALDVRTEDVIDMEGKLYLADQAFEAPVDATQDEPCAPAAYLEDRSYEPESAVSRADFIECASNALEDALATLDNRSRDIIQSRWLVDADKKTTLKALAQRYKVSIERIRQIEAAAISRLRESLSSRLGTDSLVFD